MNESLPDPAKLIARLFPRKRALLLVEVDLDPVPGWGNEAEDWRAMLQHYLDNAAPHYNPSVTARPPLPPTDPAAYQWPDIGIAGEENERRNREWWSE